MDYDFSHDKYAVALSKKGETYILFYTFNTACQAMKQLTRWAGNSELSFSWHDAAMVGKKILDGNDNCCHDNTPRL